MDLVLVLGAQGVGKSTVIKEAIDELKEDYQILNFGKVLQEVVEGKDRDKFRRETTIGEYKEVQESVAKKIKKRIQKDKVILCSHGVLYKKAGWYPGFPRNVLEVLKPKMIVVLTAEPRNIMKRREKGGSKGRTRDKTPKEVVEEEQNATKYISFAYSMYSGATVKLIENKEGKIKRTANELAEALKSL